MGQRCWDGAAGLVPAVGTADVDRPWKAWFTQAQTRCRTAFGIAFPPHYRAYSPRAGRGLRCQGPPPPAAAWALQGEQRLTITTLLVPSSPCLPQEPRSPACTAWGGHSGGSALVGGSHRRCRTLAAVSSCRAGMGPQRWPGQQPRCSSPCGGTSWRPSAGHPEPSTLQRHGAWTHGQTCPCPPCTSQLWPRGTGTAQLHMCAMLSAGLLRHFWLKLI